MIVYVVFDRCNCLYITACVIFLRCKLLWEKELLTESLAATGDIIKGMNLESRKATGDGLGRQILGNKGLFFMVKMNAFYGMCCGLIAASLMVATSGCLAQRATSAPVASEKPGDSALVKVKTLAPEKTALRRTTTQPATVHAYHEAQIYAKVAGYLDKLNVDIGQAVEVDTPLATIAVPELVKSRERHMAAVTRLKADEKRAVAGIAVAKANVQSAGAALEQANADLKAAEAEMAAECLEHHRILDLVDRKAVAARLGDEATNRCEAAKAAKISADAAVTTAKAKVSVANAMLAAANADLATAKAQTEVASKELEELEALLSYATLSAPFSGIVTERHTDPGDLIRETPTSGQDSPPLFVVAQLNKVRVRVAVPERDAPWASVGDTATLKLQALPGQSFEGKISRVAGSLDDSTRTMLVEMDLENADRKLLPGMFGEATIVLEEQNGSSVLPAGVVRYDEKGHSYVYVVDSSGKVQVVDVTVGLDDGHSIQITEGLTGSERVVDAMIGRLKAGQQVRVVE
jgi:HlyD family secretion protein